MLYLYIFMGKLKYCLGTIINQGYAIEYKMHVGKLISNKIQFL